jgi:hypothetical protein
MEVMHIASRALASSADFRLIGPRETMLPSTKPFEGGSMAPKVEGACRFVEHTGKPATIGAFKDAARLHKGDCGTTVHSHSPIVSKYSQQFDSA